MKRSIIAFAILACCVAAFASDPPTPAHPWIARVQILVTDLAEARSFYTKVLVRRMTAIGASKCPVAVSLSTTSRNLAFARIFPVASNLIKEITFATDDVPSCAATFYPQRAVSEPQGKDKAAGPSSPLSILRAPH